KMDSLVLQAADATRVPAGSALAVDRDKFAQYITERVKNHPLIEVIEAEATEIPEGVVVVATGPLTSAPMADAIASLTGQNGWYFYDAVAPIVDFSSIDMDVAFFASRYDKGDADYINCPMSREQYDAFYQALISAKEAELHEFDQPDGGSSPKVFEGCMPVEVMARRGYDTLRYGPLKPVGLVDKRTGRESFAVVQLRKENKEGSMYNLVGFQTHLTFPEQKRVFSLIPGLENATFLRYGVMHRNTYLHSPGFLDDAYATKARPTLFFAGQMTGVEGYIESAGSGLVAGINAARAARAMPAFRFPRHTMLGAMASYVANGGIGDFVPMNANFGIVERLDHKVRGGKAARNEALSARALAALDEVIEQAKE
ncbi:MAG: methylenetetrahydrofolate--tRNA-(uracil(54)-C(5))-methyltransferase (FADH(2)-oxidizing) TrmFO, partial [Clostridia bacterium]|nr:methylenetetrahydrofolate--tRNA-(uracil(54)-C(5))-methyltransferase (FADH(2)-oxidizing) TrmFO [Clostridia bacterium]